jgi:hypothetical protein
MFARFTSRDFQNIGGDEKTGGSRPNYKSINVLSQGFRLGNRIQSPKFQVVDHKVSLLLRRTSLMWVATYMPGLERWSKNAIPHAFPAVATRTARE